MFLKKHSMLVSAYYYSLLIVIISDYQKSTGANKKEHTENHRYVFMDFISFQTGL